MSNVELIRMHLEEMLRETGQYGAIDGLSVVAYCIGYYEKIDLDHLSAIRDLILSGAIKA